MKNEEICVTSLAAKFIRRFGLRCIVGPLSCLASVLFLSAVFCGSAAAQLKGCPLNSPKGATSHVVYIQFDNLHFERDNPNVPSDLEQMPHLLNFITKHGTLFANDHTPLISHTADDILTSLTGVYPDRHGQAVANSFVIFNPPGSKFWDSFPTSFTYWTDPVSTSSAATLDTAYSMITEGGLNAPAPWVPFTRAGCNVGAVSIANMELENTGEDILNVFGAGSPEAVEAKSSSSKATADFVGVAIHCAQGSSVCSGANGKPDLLPQEPGGYAGFNAVFGHKYVVPLITASGQLNDLSGNPIPGFPGFGGISPSQTLGYVAAMLENGVPVVFSYISDAHDCHVAAPACQPSFRAFGPGEAGYVAQLQAYDTAFDQFFQRLAGEGIDSTNTLFVISSDEQDHFVGGPAAPSNCDGLHVPCTYAYSNGSSSIGEIDADMAGLLNQQFPSLVPDLSKASSIFDFHFDMAPAFYINGLGPNGTGDPNLARQFERAVAQLTAVSPITGKTDQLTRYQVDTVGLKALHMITGDPARTPNFVMFADPDYYFQGANSCTVRTSCLLQQGPGFAWNHGGVAKEINTTWVGMVGPGVERSGIDFWTWADHTDIRPTMLLLTGLEDSYASDGRVLVERVHPSALPPAARCPEFQLLASVYKQLNAPVGSFGQSTLKISTVALASGSSGDDSKYHSLESKLSSLTAQRDAIAAEIRSALDGAEFKGKPLEPWQALQLTFKAQGVLWQMAFLEESAEGEGFWR